MTLDEKRLEALKLAQESFDNDHTYENTTQNILKRASKFTKFLNGEDYSE